MCEFCREWENKETICGSEIHISYCENRNHALTDAQVLKSSADDKPEIVIFSYGMSMGYFGIKFCPMCGRKLSEV